MRLAGVRSRRSSVILYGLLELRGFNVKVRVRDLSPDGAQIDAPFGLSPGNRVALACNGAGPVAATVAWVRDNRCGLTFDVVADPNEH